MSKSFSQGFRTTKTHRFDEQRLTLRIHRGRSSLHSKGPPAGGSPAPTKRLERSNTHDKIQISVSMPPPEAATAYAVHYTPSANGEGSAAAGLLGVATHHHPQQLVSPSSCDSGEDSNRPRFVSKMGKRNIKAQVSLSKGIWLFFSTSLASPWNHKMSTNPENGIWLKPT